MFENSPILRWKKQRQYYLLEGNKCLKCNKFHYPQSYYCNCGSKLFENKILSGQGKLLSYTKITIPPKAFEKMSPYYIGIIQLEEGPQIISQITDISKNEIKIGMKLKACFRKYYKAGDKGVINYGIKFIPNLKNIHKY